jgi:hypothetical protein
MQESKRIKFVTITFISTDIEGKFKGVYGIVKDMT